MLQVTDLGWAQIMANERIHAGGAFNGVLDLLVLRLFTNALIPTRSTVAGDLVAPVYAGYADKSAIVLGATYQRSDGGFAVDTPVEQFQMGDALLPSTIRGYGLLLTGGTVLFAAETLPAPVTLVTVLDALNLISQFCLGGDDNGQCVVIG